MSGFGSKADVLCRVLVCPEIANCGREPFGLRNFRKIWRSKLGIAPLYDIPQIKNRQPGSALEEII